MRAEPQPIITLTMNPALDVSSAVDQVVADRKLRCAAERLEPGGGGVNVSRVVQRLGGKSLAIFPAGGATGEAYARLVTEAGLEHRVVSIAGWTRQNLMVYETTTTRQFRFCFPGPALSAEEWGRSLDEVAAVTEPGSIVVASGSLPPAVPEDFYGRLVRTLKPRGIKIVIDTSGPALQAAAEGPFLLKMNLREFGQLLGRELSSEPDGNPPRAGRPPPWRPE